MDSAHDIPSSYRPNESSAAITNEHRWLAGVFLAAIAYGTEAILYMLTSFVLLKRRNTLNSRRNLLLIGYTAAVFILSTLYLAGVLGFTQTAFIDGRNIPGGPGVFEETIVTLPIEKLFKATMVLKSWLCNLIALWRCFVIYQGCRVPSVAVNSVPGVLYLANIALGILYVARLETTSILKGWQANTNTFASIFLIVSSVLSILVTILVISRLVLYRYRVSRVSGKSYGSRYTTLAAITVESSFIQSLFALCLIGTSLAGSTGHVFYQVYSPIQGVATYLIIFRVAKDEAYTREAFASAMQACVRCGAREIWLASVAYGLFTLTSIHNQPEIQGST
ncbi:hypothetical protein NP233_g11044 [Leucocoprinus birnbaumii]|uniref:Uncharacterized protein n=1 Tax=Leucocoprinus birnbaumii TaxID=56174 RepID=A0AAD5VJ87_9AGAR|nr:hypothetical protein NP233_g11044 [Leucocoprinus birnbaumii]